MAACTTSSIPIACNVRIPTSCCRDFIDHAVDKRHLLAERRAHGEIQTPP
jgi:hypothetical protein